MTIEILKEKILKEKLERLAKEEFGDMIKGVVDVKQRVIALGGELHADAEAILLEQGSKQEHLWGFNIYLNRPKEERLEFSSFINIRPSDNNRSMDIQSQEIKKEIGRIVEGLID